MCSTRTVTSRGNVWRQPHEPRDEVAPVAQLVARRAQSGGDARYSSHRGVAQLGRALALGARSRRFKSCYPDMTGLHKPDLNRAVHVRSQFTRCPGLGSARHALTGSNPVIPTGRMIASVRFPPSGSKRWMDLPCRARLAGCGFESHSLLCGAVAQ